MSTLKPNDKVEWRAGPSASQMRLRKGVVKDIIDDRTCLVSMEIEGKNVVEEIRVKRLRKVEEPVPEPTPKKKRLRKVEEPAPEPTPKKTEKKSARKTKGK
ncbi:MAG: hypothetical protein NTZ78_02295 [Candidatus Aureabacteria bacterium]|nr:hypothetical protein [Candidatus Auribacterota bacterium]